MKISRRSMLTTGIALPALGLGPTSTAGARVDAPVLDSSFDPWIDVNRANLQHNVAEISRRVGSRPILAVIKNNGYGLGVVNVGQSSSPPPQSRASPSSSCTRPCRYGTPGFASPSC